MSWMVENPARHHRQSQELVEPGGDHEGRPQGGGSSEHGTGGGQAGQAAEVWKTTVEIPRIWDRTVS